MAADLQGKHARSSAAGRDADVIVVGSGPTGMVLAAELALGGAHVMVLERRPDQALPGSRAGGLHPRTLEVLDQRGVADRFVAEGKPVQAVSFAGSEALDLSDFPTRFPHTLALWQARIEAILADWIGELPVRLQRDCTVTGVLQDDDGVDLVLSDEKTLRAAYVVGCDGGRSLVRRAADIAFSGTDASTSYMLAEAEMPDDPVMGFTFDEQGRHAIGPLEDGEHRVRLVIQEQPPQVGDQPSVEELRAAVVAVWGTDFGLHSPTWISRFSDAARQAETYRAGRVLVAGDAAHVHSPVGGQGLGTGVQDAVNLGWKLAQVVRGISPESLLDTYHDERHPVGARVLQGTLAMTALMATDDRTSALRDLLADVLATDESRRRIGARFAGLDLRYDLGDGHPLLGRRMPDVDLETAAGLTRVYEFLHQARPLLLSLRGGPAAPSSSPTEVQFVAAQAASQWELPVIGLVDAPPAVLVRPDGHVAWTGELDDPGLAPAVSRWFGAGA